MQHTPYLRLVASRPDPVFPAGTDNDLTEIAAGLADVVIEKANLIARAATADDVATISIFMFGHATDKGPELREVIRRCWIMVAQRQEASRRLAAARPARSRKAVPSPRDQGRDDRQLEMHFGGAA